MNRALAALALAAVVTFGVSACSGSTTPPAAETSQTPAAPDSGTPAPDTSSLQACLDLAGPFAEAGTAMTEAMSGGDAQSAVDAWSQLTDAAGAVAQNTSDPDVRAAANTTRDDFAALRDALKKTYVDGDLGAATEVATASTAVQSSYQTLIGLCAP